jgi:hypothetical protein
MLLKTPLGDLPNEVFVVLDSSGEEVRAFFREALPQILGGSVVSHDHALLSRPRRTRPFSTLEVATAQPFKEPALPKVDWRLARRESRGRNGIKAKVLRSILSGQRPGVSAAALFEQRRGRNHRLTIQHPLGRRGGLHHNARGIGAVQKNPAVLLKQTGPHRCP